MERTRPDPLTPEEAKSRLLERARAIGPRAWLERHPYEGLATSALLGFALGRCPRLAGGFGRMLLQRLLRN